MEFQLGHILSIAVMDLIGICVNSWFLYIVKTRAFQLNAIDILQACKTVLCLAALLVCVWTEFVTCTSKVCSGAKAISDDICYFSTCLTFLAIAYVRYKACEYRGQASIILTHRYAIKTLLICFVPVGMFAAANLSLMINDGSSDASFHGYGANITDYDGIELLVGESKIAYEICHLAFFTFIPIFISAVLYYKICTKVTQTARTMESSMSNRKHDPSKLITLSVTVLLSTMLTIWGIYTIVRIVSLYMKLNELFFVYWKLVVLIVQPAGEGMLHKSGKKSVASRSHRLSQVRSSRQIYPINSVALSGSMIEDDSYNTVGAGKLPALIEECETQAKSSNEKSDEETAMDEEKNNKNTFRVRRKSYIHPRTSVIIRNAAMIGLEYQGKINYVDCHNQRKTSEERLRNELLNIEKDALHRHRTRRLSNCLRFTAAEDLSCDEIYHTYRNLYDRRGSKFSEKSRKSSSATSNVSDFDGLPNGSINERKDRKPYASSSGNESPSKTRWKKLYANARTARTFLELRNGVSPPVVEEEATESLEKKPSKVIEKDILGKHDMSLETMQKEPTVCLDQQSLSLDSNSNKTLVSKPKVQSSKKRSISCVSNVWMKNNQLTSAKKKSVSFISSVELDGPSTSDRDPNIARSISYDSRIYLSYRKESEGKKIKVRHSHDHKRMENNTQERAKVEKWLTDRATTREECIAKLMEMKEYF